MIKKFFKFNFFLLKVFFFLIKFRNWAINIPKVKASRIISICLSTSLAYLHGKSDQMLITAKIGQLIFSIDDLIDENNISPAVLVSIFNDPKIGEVGYFILDIYKEIISNMEINTLNVEYLAKFKVSLNEFILSIANESDIIYDLDKGKPYWENRKNTSGIKAVGLSVLTLTQKEYIEYTDFVDRCSLMVRLANDSRSYIREKDEKSLNIIKLRIDNGELSENVIIDVRKQIVNLRNSLEMDLKVSNNSIEGIFLLADFITRMYAEMDFHNSKLRPLLGLWVKMAWRNI